MSGEQEGYRGVERREEPELKVLQNEIYHIKEALIRIERSLEAIEAAAQRACETCALRLRVETLERAKEKLDDRLRYLEVKVGGISLITSLATSIITAMIIFAVTKR